MRRAGLVREGAIWGLPVTRSSRLLCGEWATEQQQGRRHLQARGQCPFPVMADLIGQAGRGQDEFRDQPWAEAGVHWGSRMGRCQLSPADGLFWRQHTFLQSVGDNVLGLVCPGAKSRVMPQLLLTKVAMLIIAFFLGNTDLLIRRLEFLEG